MLINLPADEPTLVMSAGVSRKTHLLICHGHALISQSLKCLVDFVVSMFVNVRLVVVGLDVLDRVTTLYV